ncbi:hypothetical protein [Streptomyces sp. NPDC004134]|uniref:hypothetical protein n=1 Tax=Streptomyces sp. NPDC004134 TaxID=3364691 RepID=UPI00368C072D
MHEKLLHRAGDRLTHRHHARPSATARTGTEGLVLDPAKIRALRAGTLGPRDEAGLAREVAVLLPHGWDLPYKLKAALQEIIAHLGSEAELMKWLDTHPGRPRLTARIYAFLGVLDQHGGTPEVVRALRESRSREPYPPGLQHVLVPQTDAETLSDLGYRVEALLADGEDEKATALALATADWLRQSLSATPQTGLAGLADTVTRVRTAIARS